MAPMRENLSSGNGFANKKGADQTAHPQRLISAFVIRLVESIASKLARREIAIFYVVAVAEQAGLGMTWLETSKTWPIYSKTCVKRPL